VHFRFEHIVVKSVTQVGWSEETFTRVSKYCWVLRLWRYDIMTTSYDVSFSSCLNFHADLFSTNGFLYFLDCGAYSRLRSALWSHLRLIFHTIFPYGSTVWRLKYRHFVGKCFSGGILLLVILIHPHRNAVSVHFNLFFSVGIPFSRLFWTGVSLWMTG